MGLKRKIRDGVWLAQPRQITLKSMTSISTGVHIRLYQKDVVLTERIELSTSALPKQRSTTELRQHKNTNISIQNAVDKETLTRLTKGVLYP